MARLPRVLPTIGQQGDIAYVGISARTALNRPEQTGMPYWSINPYVGCAFGCAYCYARYAHRYLSERTAAASEPAESIALDASDGTPPVPAMPPWLAFERRIFVKRNVADVLRDALRNGSARHAELARGETLVIGTATDPYQPAERHFRLTRSVLETLAEHAGLRVVIITKSALITRDIDVLRRLARHSRVTVNLSLITLDRDLARRLEPRAPTPASTPASTSCPCFPGSPTLPRASAPSSSVWRRRARRTSTPARSASSRKRGNGISPSSRRSFPTSRPATASPTPEATTQAPDTARACTAWCASCAPYTGSAAAGRKRTAPEPPPPTTASSRSPSKSRPARIRRSKWALSVAAPNRPPNGCRSRCGLFYSLLSVRLLSSGPAHPHPVARGPREASSAGWLSRLLMAMPRPAQPLAAGRTWNGTAGTPWSWCSWRPSFTRTPSPIGLPSTTTMSS